MVKDSTGKIYQINVKPRTPGQRGLPKLPVESVMVTYRGLEGDFNNYRYEERHDDPDMALLVMPLETIKQLNEEGWPIQPGDIGENITTLGIPYSSFVSGKRYGLGEAEIQISRRCDPCSNLYLLPYVGQANGPRFLKTMLDRRGWYARVLQEGAIRKGDSIHELDSPL